MDIEQYTIGEWNKNHPKPQMTVGEIYRWARERRKISRHMRENGSTYREIAERLNVSPERARMIVASSYRGSHRHRRNQD